MINACGPFVDRLRQLDDPSAKPILKASTGIHIILSRRFAPPEAGLMIPKTEDGRVLFILPWQGHTLIGTTEAASEIVDPPAGQGRGNRIPAAAHQPLFQPGGDARRRQIGMVRAASAGTGARHDQYRAVGARAPDRCQRVGAAHRRPAANGRRTVEWPKKPSIRRFRPSCSDARAPAIPSAFRWSAPNTSTCTPKPA